MRGCCTAYPHWVRQHNVRERYGRWRLLAIRTGWRHTARIGVSGAVCADTVPQGHPPSRCTVIHNSIHRTLAPRAALGRKGIGLGHASAVLHAKRPRHLIQAPTAGSARPRPKAVPAGTGKNAGARLPTIGGYPGTGIAGGVSATVPTCQLCSLVKWCVLSTHYGAGLGLGLIEGMVSGCCAIGSNVEGVQEVIAHGQTGGWFHQGQIHTARAQAPETADHRRCPISPAGWLGMHHARPV